MPSPGQSALKFLRSNLRRGAKPKVRVAVLGQASVGKTALIVRYVTRRFIYDYAPEIAKVYQHQTVLDQEDVHMEIWDTAGHFQSQAELRHLEVFVRWADVVLLVYSITDKASFHLAVQLLQQISLMRLSTRQQQQHPQESEECATSSSSSPNTLPIATMTLRDNNKPIVEFCENCPDFPIMLIGTKSDMWRERQIAVDAGAQMCADFGCSNYKEISTKESVDEVAEVFEAALRSGWLFRQHRELTKHRNLFLHNSVSSSLEKSNTIDNGALESCDYMFFPPASPSPYIGAISCTPMINSDAPNGDAVSRRKSLSSPAPNLSPSGGPKYRPTFLSSIKKCIAPTAYRPSHHSVPPSPHHPQLCNNMDTSQIEEEVERNRRRFFRARSNTGALVAREPTATEPASGSVSGSISGSRSRSMSFAGRGSLSPSTGGIQSASHEKPRRKTSIIFP